MDKITGQQLKKDLEATATKLANLENKINKKFDLIVTDYWKYLSEDHNLMLNKLSMSDMTLDRKLEVIIQTEANYVKANGNQVEMF